MEAGKTPSASSFSFSSSKEDVSLIPPRYLSKKRAEEGEDVSLSKKWARSSLQVSPANRPLSRKMSMSSPCNRPKTHEEKDCFIVKLKPPQNGEQDELINKLEAACTVCSTLLVDTDSVLKTKCKCQFTLLHETCRDKLSMCNKCQQIMKTVPVTISSSDSGTKPRKKKGGLISHFFNLFSWKK